VTCSALATVTQASVQDATATRATSLPAFAELQRGWNVLRPGGDTICAKGGEYAFSVRPGARDKLLVFFQGGGGCWRGEECDRGQPFYTPAIDLEAARSALDEGIFDATNPENPFSTYSAVMVRYCTGDVHLGDREATYTVSNDKGEKRQFTIHHRGQVNAMAVLKWVQANFVAPREIFVAGTSAGSIPTPFYASVLARHYPQSRVVGLGDAQGHRNSLLRRGESSQWGMPDALRRHQGWERFPDIWDPADFYLTAARLVPRLNLCQVNHAYDAVTRSFIRLAGNEDVDMLAMLRANQREIGSRVKTFRYFNLGGRAHGALPDDRFYAYATSGHRFRDWVAAIAEGRPVSSVDCKDCRRSEYNFSEQDLRIVERALALISTPGAWNNDDAPQRCRPKLDRFSLECALLTAVNEVMERPPHFRHAAVWEVIYAAIARLGAEFEREDAQSQRGSESALPLRLYNNRKGTTVADVISLLEAARDRIRADLSRKINQKPPGH
jgi:Pectinacetylesterase